MADHALPARFGMGQMGSALMGSLQMVFGQRDLLGTPVNLFVFPKSARAYLFPQSLKLCYLCSGPISVDTMCPQPNSVQRALKQRL